MENFQHILNQIPGNFFLKDLNSKMLWSNPTFANLAGETPSSIIGKTDYDLPWRTEEAAHFINDDRAVIANNLPKFHIEEQMRQANGLQTTILTYKVPYKNTEQQIIGVLGVCYDLTEQSKIAIPLLNKYKQIYNNYTAFINKPLTVTHKDTQQAVVLPIYLSACLWGVTQGKSSKQIAKACECSFRTIEHYTAKLKSILGCASIKELIYYYARQLHY